MWVEEAVRLGVATNNEAEYTAVKLALQRLAHDFSSDLPSVVEIKTDSQLVARQLAGIYKIKNPKLKVLFEEIKKLQGDIGKIVYTHIPRQENYLTDRLVNQSLDTQ